MEARSVYLILGVREGGCNISKAFRENQFNNPYRTNVLSAKTSREFIDNRISSPSRTRSSRDPYPRSFKSQLRFHNILVEGYCVAISFVYPHFELQS